MTDCFGGEELFQLSSLLGIVTAQQHHNDSESCLSYSHTILTGFCCIVLQMCMTDKMKLLIWLKSFPKVAVPAILWHLDNSA